MKTKPARLLFLGYAIFLIYATSIPFDFVTDQAALSQKLQDIRWTPFVREDGRRESIPDMFSNILLFLPFGIGLFYAFREKWVRIPGMPALIRALTGGALFSSIVEFIQLFCPGRTTSVTDVVTNGAGACLGFWVARIFHNYYQANVITWISTRFKDNPRRMWLMLIFAFIFLFSLMPFDFSLDIGHLKAQIKAIQLHPSFDRAGVFNSLELFFPYAILGLCCLLYGQRSLAVLLLGLSFAPMVEVLQIFTDSHGFSLNDLLFNWAGFIFGVGLGVVLLLLGRSQNPVNLIFLQYLAFLIIISFFPFQFGLSQGNSARINLLPFLLHYARTNFQAVNDWLQGILVFIPFGAYLMWKRQSCFNDTNLASRIVKKETVILLFVIGLMVEICQIFLPGRFADVTDIISAVLGGYLGIVLYSRLLQRFLFT